MNNLFLNEAEIRLFKEGSHCRTYQFFGAHPVMENEKNGVRFSLWAPHAQRVCVAGDFNGWNTESHNLELYQNTGIWSGFISGIGPGQKYKYAIFTPEGEVKLKADPYAFHSEKRPLTASIVSSLNTYTWNDKQWVEERSPLYDKPLNIYEVHPGSWKRKGNGNFYTFRELAHELIPYVLEMGFTHIELMPIMEHPFDGSWGYQVTGYFAVTSRYGNPEDLMYLIDCCHNKGIGVILDWVPSHFCKDAHGLGQFDGTPLYEGEENREWGTLSFNFAKQEIVSFLISNAVFWFDVFHVDGLRIDAVASMLYLDYGKKEGTWKPNICGGRENLEAVKFMQRLNESVFKDYPCALMIAEESTAWPLVTKPTYDGGLGYNYKWNMGWMNDLLKYMQLDPLFRKEAHNLLTFSLCYAFSENFILPLSHDEVVHGKKSLIDKMPGSYQDKFANLRLMLGYMMTHPGKKHLFMGAEIAQFIEWRFYEELEWGLLDFEMHKSFKNYVQDLNSFYLREKALWENDFNWRGFEWIDADNAQQSVLIFQRNAGNGEDFLIVVCNFTSVYYEKFRIGVPKAGSYREVFNSDNVRYGGTGKALKKIVKTRKKFWQNRENSVEIILPPLTIVCYGIVGKRKVK